MTHREEIWNKAEKALFDKYGEHPDISIVNRFLSEKIFLAGVVEYFDELASIIKESVDVYNEKIIAKNTVSCCFTAYLLGATSINPLPAHRFCKNCKRVEWAEEGTCLFDMKSTHKCICGAEMHADGYGLEWELYLPYYAKKHKEKKDGIFGNRYHDLFESILSTHFQKNLLDATQACHLLGQFTGVPPEKIHFDDTKVKSQLLSGSFSSLPPKMAVFLREAAAKPRNYCELIKLISFAHGTYTWKNNAELLIAKGICNIKDIPASRDEVYTSILNAMRKHNIYDTGFAYDLTYKTYHGYYREYGMVDEYTASTLKKLGFEDWFTKYIANVYYMAPKALAVLELRLFIALTYYKTHFPEQFTALDVENIWEGDT